MVPMPDEDIFPHATGAAEKVVAAHQAPCDLVYHGSWFCPFVQVCVRDVVPTPAPLTIHCKQFLQLACLGLAGCP